MTQGQPGGEGDRRVRLIGDPRAEGLGREVAADGSGVDDPRPARRGERRVRRAPGGGSSASQEPRQVPAASLESRRPVPRIGDRGRGSTSRSPVRPASQRRHRVDRATRRGGRPAGQPPRVRSETARRLLRRSDGARAGQHRDDVRLPSRQSVEIDEHAIAEPRRQLAAHVEALGRRRSRYRRRPVHDRHRAVVVDQHRRRGRAVVRERHAHAAIVDQAHPREVLARRRQRGVADRGVDGAGAPVGRGPLRLAMPPACGTRSRRRAAARCRPSPPARASLSSSHRRSPSTVRSRPLATAPSIAPTTPVSTGSGQPDRQHAPECRHA